YGEGLLVEVRGRNLCGDASLETRADQHNGIEGVPQTFDETTLPVTFEPAPNSRRRLFRVNNLSEATHSLKVRLKLRRDFIRPTLGGDIVLPNIHFTRSLWSLPWTSGLLIMFGGLFAAVYGLRTRSEEDASDVNASPGTGAGASAPVSEVVPPPPPAIPVPPPAKAEVPRPAEKPPPPPEDDDLDMEMPTDPGIVLDGADNDEDREKS
ncbi:MAG: hypothetical protein QGG40_06740, partial [Myxococcota bacterium]|nr:hypothetical protein [Myxococcota bacterium]